MWNIFPNKTDWSRFLELFSSIYFFNANKSSPNCSTILLHCIRGIFYFTTSFDYLQVLVRSNTIFRVLNCGLDSLFSRMNVNSHFHNNILTSSIDFLSLVNLTNVSCNFPCFNNFWKILQTGQDNDPIFLVTTARVVRNIMTHLSRELWPFSIDWIFDLLMRDPWIYNKHEHWNLFLNVLQSDSKTSLIWFKNKWNVSNFISVFKEVLILGTDKVILSLMRVLELVTNESDCFEYIGVFAFISVEVVELVYLIDINRL